MEALENAYELDPKVTTLRQMLKIYEDSDDAEGAMAMAARIEAQIAKETEIKRRKATDRALKAMRAATPVKKKVGLRATRQSSAKSVIDNKKATTRKTRIVKKTVTKGSAGVVGGVSTSRVTQRVATGGKTSKRTAGSTRLVKPHVGRKRI